MSWYHTFLFHFLLNDASFRAGISGLTRKAGCVSWIQCLAHCSQKTRWTDHPALLVSRYRRTPYRLGQHIPVINLWWDVDIICYEPATMPDLPYRGAPATRIKCHSEPATGAKWMSTLCNRCCLLWSLSSNILTAPANWSAVVDGKPSLSRLRYCRPRSLGDLWHALFC